MTSYDVVLVNFKQILQIVFFGNSVVHFYQLYMIIRVFYKKGVLRKFAKFIGKHLSQGLFFNKVSGLRP